MVSKLYLFVYLDFVSHDFDFYYFFRIVWFLWKFCRKLSTNLVFFHPAGWNFFSNFFSKDFLWYPLLLLLDRRPMDRSSVKHKTFITFQLFFCGQPATRIFWWWLLMRISYSFLFLKFAFSQSPLQNIKSTLY